MRNKLGILAILLLSGQLLLAQTGLVADLRMNGDADDVQGNHSATVNGATLTTDRYGRANSAYYFDGQDDYLELSNLNALKFSEFSYSVWVEVTTVSSGSYMPIISIGGSNGDQGIFIANNYYSQYTGCIGYGWTSCSSTTAYNASTGVVPSSTWHHIVYTRNATEGKIYMDGVLASTKTIPSSCPPYYATSLERAVVGMRFNQTKHFKGKLDELKIFNYALDADEVSAVYENSAEIGVCYLDMPEEEEGVVEYTEGVLTSSSLERTEINFSEQISPIAFCKVSPIPDLGDAGILGFSLQLSSFGEDEASSYVGVGFRQESRQYYFELGLDNIHIYMDKELIYTASNKTALGDRIELGLEQSEIHFYKNGLEIGEPQAISEKESGRLYLGLTGNTAAVENIRIRTICQEQDFNSNAELVINSTTYECMDFVAGPPYYELKDELDGAFYDCVSATVYFRYKESYLSETDLGYTIYDNSYNDVTTSFTLENVHRQDTKKEYGTSYFKLQGDNSTSGFYILEVYDAKGQVKYLRFKI
ncbi:LamG domain-containing protein [Saprospira sp. CCB-QB6]|uniref:LamG domain-containing protein n=1 Tax=Saprospira sp. CCB-QB6 TaxID=3023936 RepID=UPI00234A49AE|nr:LamG domain-containing protein [Saprospira sp. CCB-QB6]WCL81767.1 LamG domain-containing protein [Saprospira sp. CCB-QB6]